MATTISISSIKLLLVNDQPLMGQALCSILRDANLSVVETKSQSDWQALAQSFQPDLLLLNLPLITPPFEIIDRCLRCCPTVKIVAFGNEVDYKTVTKWVEVGAAGYILKTEAPEIVLQALSTVAQGGTWFSQPVVAQLVQPSRQILLPELTLREKEVLVEVVAGKTNREIADQLSLSQKTVERYVSKICTKLEVTSRVEAAVKTVRHGLIDKPSAPTGREYPTSQSGTSPGNEGGTSPSNNREAERLLTQREREVLALVAQGRSNAQIAEMLNLAKRTISNYVSHIYTKLDVTSRAEAIVWARERGIK